MEQKDEIGFQVHTLSLMIRRLVDQTVFSARERPVTGRHGRIIGYLYENRFRDVYQRDLEREFAIRRSTVTGMLQLMEKNGLIRRESVKEDARLKKIVLTQKAVNQHEQIRAGIIQVEEKLAAGMTPEEKRTFLSLCEKIRHNLEE